MEFSVSQNEIKIVIDEEFLFRIPVLSNDQKNDGYDQEIYSYMIKGFAQEIESLRLVMGEEPIDSLLVTLCKVDRSHTDGDERMNLISSIEYLYEGKELGFINFTAMDYSLGILSKRRLMVTESNVNEIVQFFDHLSEAVNQVLENVNNRSRISRKTVEFKMLLN